MLNRSSSVISDLERTEIVDSVIYEESFYCSAVQHDEDVICAGSDTEESPEETLAKRYRYDEAARRFARGIIPLLQSASLRGPFDNEWVNPWRYRTRTKPHWWQSGPSDGLRSRPDTLEAVAEKKQTHSKGVEISTRSITRVTDRERPFGAELPKARIDEVSARIGDYVHTPDRASEEQSQERNLAYEAHLDHESHSIYGPGIQEPRTKPMRLGDGGLPSSIGMGTADAKASRITAVGWLRGSDVSKLSRWEPTRLSTPTPVIDPTSGAKRRRKIEVQRVSYSKDAHTIRHASLGRTVEAKQRKISLEGQDAESPPTTNLRHEEKYKHIHRGFGGQRPDYFNRSSSKQNRQLSTSLAKMETHSLLSSSVSSKRKAARRLSMHDEMSLSQPILTDGSNGNHLQASGNSSFITEVAPSCGDLAAFQYRKRRKIEDLPACDNAITSPPDFQLSTSSNDNLFDEDDGESGVTHEGTSSVTAVVNSHENSPSPSHRVEVTTIKSAHEEQASNGPSSSVQAPDPPFSKPLLDPSQNLQEDQDSNNPSSNGVKDLFGDDLFTKVDTSAPDGELEAGSPRFLPAKVSGMISVPQSQTIILESSATPAKSDVQTSSKSTQAGKTLAQGKNVSIGDSGTQSCDTMRLEAQSMLQVQNDQESNRADVSSSVPNLSDFAGDDSITEEVQAQISADQSSWKDGRVDKSLYSPEPECHLLLESASASWQPAEELDLPTREPQSPWHPETDDYQAPSYDQISDNEAQINHDDSGAQIVKCKRTKRPITPENDITPFSDFTSPAPSPRKAERKNAISVMPSTQQVLEATVSNPWLSSLKTMGSGKSQKRVSFESLQTSAPVYDAPLARMSSPPPPATSGISDGQRGGQVADESPVTRRFEQHFAAATRFKPLLGPDKGFSQGSPGIIAMAERFIAADKNAGQSFRKHAISPNSSPRPLLSSSPSRINTHLREDAMLPHPGAEAEAKDPSLHDPRTDADLGSMLDEMGSFLEEWSVDTELKRMGTGASNVPNGGGAPGHSSRSRLKRPW